MRLPWYEADSKMRDRLLGLYNEMQQNADILNKMISIAMNEHKVVYHHCRTIALERALIVPNSLNYNLMSQLWAFLKHINDRSASVVGVISNVDRALPMFQSALNHLLQLRDAVDAETKSIDARYSLTVQVVGEPSN